jgi:hypothetical protein
MRTARKLSQFSLAVFVAMPALGIVHAQTTNASTTMNPAATAACRQGQYIEDASGSPAADQLLDLRRKVLDKLPQIATQAGIVCWGIASFYEDGFNFPELVHLNFQSNTVPPCAAVHNSEMGSLIRAIGIPEEEEQKKSCETERKKIEDDWNRRAAASVAAASRALSSNHPKGRCTSLADVLVRVAGSLDETLQLIVIATDAQESCQLPIRAIPAPAIKRRVVMLVVGGASEKAGAADRFNDRKARWHKAAEWVEFVSASNVDAVLSQMSTPH